MASTPDSHATPIIQLLWHQHHQKKSKLFLACECTRLLWVYFNTITGTNQVKVAKSQRRPSCLRENADQKHKAAEKYQNILIHFNWATQLNSYCLLHALDQLTGRPTVKGKQLGSLGQYYIVTYSLPLALHYSQWVCFGRNWWQKAEVRKPERRDILYWTVQTKLHNDKVFHQFLHWIK